MLPEVGEQLGLRQRERRLASEHRGQLEADFADAVLGPVQDLDDTRDLGSRLDGDGEDRLRQVARGLRGLAVETGIALHVVHGDRLTGRDHVPGDAALHGQAHADHARGGTSRRRPEDQLVGVGVEHRDRACRARRRPPAPPRRWPSGLRRGRPASERHRGRIRGGPDPAAHHAAWSPAQHRAPRAATPTDGTSAARPSGGRGGAKRCGSELVDCGARDRCSSWRCPSACTWPATSASFLLLRFNEASFLDDVWPSTSASFLLPFLMEASFLTTCGPRPRLPSCCCFFEARPSFPLCGPPDRRRPGGRSFPSPEECLIGAPPSVTRVTRCVCHGPQRDSERLSARPAPPSVLPRAPRRLDDLAERRLALQRGPRGLRLRPDRFGRMGRGGDRAAARPLRRAGADRGPRRRPVRPPVGHDLVGRGAGTVDGGPRGRRCVRGPGARGHPPGVHDHRVRDRVSAGDDGGHSGARRRGRPRGGQRLEHAGRQPHGRRGSRGRRGRSSPSLLPPPRSP